MIDHSARNHTPARTLSQCTLSHPYTHLSVKQHGVPVLQVSLHNITDTKVFGRLLQVHIPQVFAVVIRFDVVRTCRGWKEGNVYDIEHIISMTEGDLNITQAAAIEDDVDIPSRNCYGSTQRF